MIELGDPWIYLSETGQIPVKKESKKTATRRDRIEDG